MESLHQKLVPWTMMRYLVELGVEDTLQCNAYEDESQNAKTFPMLDEKSGITPNRGDHYVNAEILLPRGDRMTRGQVVCQKQDANNNLMGRTNQNPILDMPLYEVEFPWGEITELATNIIAE